MNPESSIERPRRHRAWHAGTVSLVLLASTIIGCTEGEGADQRKSPFATGNVSVAPQIDGRAPVPTPVPAPRPGTDATPVAP